jgi:hypothetical protein
MRWIADHVARQADEVWLRPMRWIADHVARQADEVWLRPMRWIADHGARQADEVWFWPLRPMLSLVRCRSERAPMHPCGQISLFPKKRCVFSISSCVLSHLRDCRKFVHNLFAGADRGQPSLWGFTLKALWPRLNRVFAQGLSCRLIPAFLCQRLFFEADGALALSGFYPLWGEKKQAHVGRQR